MSQEAQSPLLHELVAEQALRRPEAIALSLGDTTATYQRLHHVADGFAGKMRAHGVQAGEPVAVLMHRTPRRVVGLLAILRAGAAYLGLDPDDPPERHAELVRAAGVRFVISDLEGELPEGLKVLTPETPVDEAADPGAPNQASESPAYLGWTAAEPVGVAVSHEAVARIVDRPQGLAIDPDDVVLHLAPLASDAAALEVWAALTHGCRLAILPPGPVDVDRLARTVAAEKVTVLVLPEDRLGQLTDSYPAVLAAVPKIIALPDRGRVPSLASSTS